MKTKYSQQIEKFINGELTPAEREAFLEELKINAELRDEFRLENDIATALSDQDVIAFRQQLNDVRRSTKQESGFPGREGKIRRLAKPPATWILLAASVLIIAGIAAYLFLVKAESLNTKLYCEYYRPYPAETIERSDSLALPAAYLEGLQKYEQEHYTEALTLFEAALREDPELLPAFLYAGICCIETNSLSTALDYFNRIIHAGPGPISVQARWYAIMAMLKMNDNEKVPTILSLCRDITGSKGDKAEEAKVIMEKIEETR